MKPAAPRNPLSPPEWILRLHPELRGIEENPLYLRLTGKRFRGRRRWWRSFAPVELKKPAADGWASWIMGGSQRNGTLADRFVCNVAAEAWGQDLILTTLTPQEYDHAMLAVTLERGIGPVPLFLGVFAGQTIFGGVIVVGSVMRGIEAELGFFAEPAGLALCLACFAAIALLVSTNMYYLFPVTVLAELTGIDRSFGSGLPGRSSIQGGFLGGLLARNIRSLRQVVMFAASQACGAMVLFVTLRIGWTLLDETLEANVVAGGLFLLAAAWVGTLVNLLIQQQIHRTLRASLRGDVLRAIMNLRERLQTRRGSE